MSVRLQDIAILWLWYFIITVIVVIVNDAVAHSMLMVMLGYTAFALGLITRPDRVKT